MDNYHDVVHQLGEYLQTHGHDFRTGRDLPLKIDSHKSVGFGTKGKYWYKLHSFRPESGGELIRGSFGKYGSDTRERIEIDWKPINEAEREKLKSQLAAKRAAADAIRRAEEEEAALSAGDLWRRASKEGESPYLVKKGVVGECCRFLPDGSLIVPLIRYDLPREQALRGVQRIHPGPRVDRRTGEPLPEKTFTWKFAKQGCAVRLGEVLPGHIVLICEGYATGLTLRMACERTLGTYVALDAGNLQHVVPIVRQLNPESRLLICADDDWRTRDPITKQLNNPGRTAAKAAAKATDGCDYLYPIFDPATRQPKDTDFNDLHARQGLEAVRRQITAVVQAMRSKYG
ncbi:MAG: toprim domain-containing protein [Pseudomonadota bacterium]